MNGVLVKTGALVGLIAGIVMAMWAMIVAAVMGAGLFAPPQMIAEPLFGPVHPGTLNPSALVVGLMLHMMFSLVFGVVFAAIWQTIAQRGIVAILGGMLYGIVLWLVMSYVMAPLVGSHIAQQLPTWAWLVAHLMFGVVIGFWPIARPQDFPGVRTIPTTYRTTN